MVNVFVVEHGEFDALIFFHSLEKFNRVVGHGNYAESHCFELVTNLYQLHELRFTEWSPVEGAAQHKEHPLLTC